MSRTDPQFNLRIPAELKAQVEEAAKENKRSATAEIVARLEESFEPKWVAADEPMVVRVDLTKDKYGTGLLKQSTAVFPSPEELMQHLIETQQQVSLLKHQLSEILRGLETFMPTTPDPFLEESSTEELPLRKAERRPIRHRKK